MAFMKYCLFQLKLQVVLHIYLYIYTFRHNDEAMGWFCDEWICTTTYRRSGDICDGWQHYVYRYVVRSLLCDKLAVRARAFWWNGGWSP